MISKSLILFVVILVIFELTLRFFDLSWDTSQNDKSANIIAAQNFVYKYSVTNLNKDTIIVGSSKSRKLIMDSLGTNFINLAFNGWSAYDGLDLLKRSKTLPACILIESTGLGEVITKEEITKIFDPLLAYKHFLKSTQLKNQPVGLLIGFLKEKMMSRILAAKKLKRQNISLYNHSVKMTKGNYKKVLADSICLRSLNVIKDLVDYFKSQNVKIIFYEIPIDSALMNTAYMVSARGYYNKYFPDSVYRNIHTPPINNYVFSDGIHLLRESAIDYTKYLKNSLLKF
jgi:hypothetical protein